MCMMHTWIIMITFVYNDAAATVIDTYWPTLSLHCALPISRSRPGRRRSDSTEIAFVSIRLPSLGDGPQATARNQTAPTAALTARVGRSEEHTSELQSLMRISYAVFCLKQKQQIIQT